MCDICGCSPCKCEVCEECGARLVDNVCEGCGEPPNECYCVCGED